MNEDNQSIGVAASLERPHPVHFRRAMTEMRNPTVNANMRTVQVTYAIRREARTEADRPGTEARTRQSRQSEAAEHQGRHFPSARPTCRSQSPKRNNLSKPVRLVRSSSSSVQYPLRSKTKLCQSAQFFARESRFSASWVAQKPDLQTSGETFKP